QVVADELVGLADAPIQPSGEALVELGPDFLGERLVGGVAKQDVVKAKGLRSRYVSGVGTDEASSDQSGEASPDPFPLALGRQCLDRLPVEDLTHDRGATEKGSLGLGAAVKTRREKGLHGRWDGDV